MHIIEVRGFFADDGPWTTVSGEDTSRNELKHLPMVVCPSGDCFNTVGHIIYRYQDILFPSEGDKGPIISMPHKSKISTSRIGGIGISSRLGMFNVA